MKKKSKKNINGDKSTEDEMKLLTDFAIRLDKKNEILKKLLEERYTNKKLKNP